MDASITDAGRALCAGDPLGALKRIALRDDPAALALRGIAMAQLGDLGRARELLRRARRASGPRPTTERARCLTAEAEVALAARRGRGGATPRPRWGSRWGGRRSVRSSRSRRPARCARSAAAAQRRWLSAPVAGFATSLLLPGSGAFD